jgi:large subunit ribosomal protein L32
MGVPKRRVSKRRGRMRRAHYKLDPVHLVPCPQCRTPVISHRACPECGHYRRRQVIGAKE